MMGATLVHVGRGLIVRIPELAALISARPEGAKLDVPALARALTPSQSEIIDAIRAAIEEGALDAKTLRAPVAVPKITKCGPDKAFRPTGAEMFRRILAEAERRGLSQAEASKQIFGHKTQLFALKAGTRQPVREATFIKIEAWRAKAAELPAGEEPAPEEQAVSNSPPPAPTEQQERAAALPTRTGSAPAKSREEPTESAPPPAFVTAQQLLAEIDAYCTEHAMTVSRFGKLAARDHTLVRRFRSGSQPSPMTVDRVRTFIAAPPSDAVRRAPRKAPGLARRDASSTPSRDLTKEPVDPGLAAADKQRLAGQRHFAEIRRGQEREATALLDAGVDPSTVKSTYQANQMRQIQRRREDEARQTDPVEIAKLALRRRGRVVFNCSVTGGRADRFTVSGCRDEETGKNIQFDRGALIALARKVNPAAMEQVR